jgi:hypothetical protein
VLNQLQLTGSSNAASGVSGAFMVAGDTLNFQGLQQNSWAEGSAFTPVGSASATEV